MNDAIQQSTRSRPTIDSARREARTPRRDFIDILRDEIAKGEYLTPERNSRTVDVLAPVLAQDLTARGAA